MHLSQNVFYPLQPKLKAARCENLQESCLEVNNRSQNLRSTDVGSIVDNCKSARMATSKRNCVTPQLLSSEIISKHFSYLVFLINGQIAENKRIRETHRHKSYTESLKMQHTFFCNSSRSQLLDFCKNQFFFRTFFNELEFLGSFWCLLLFFS